MDELSIFLVLAMPELLRSAKLAVEKGQSQGRNETYVKQLSDYIVPALVEALHKVILVFHFILCHSKLLMHHIFFCHTVSMGSKVLCILYAGT